MSRNFFNASIFVAKVLSRAITKSKRYIVEAVGAGQYEFDKGVIFGGFNFQYEKEVLEPVIKNVISDYNTIVTIDLHTGLGKRGEIYLLNAPKSSLNNSCAKFGADVRRGSCRCIFILQSFHNETDAPKLVHLW